LSMSARDTHPGSLVSGTQRARLSCRCESPELPSGKVIQGSPLLARSRLYATSPVSAMRSPAVSPAIPAQKRRCPNWLLARPHIAATIITMQAPNHGRLRKLASSAITDYPLVLGLSGIPGRVLPGQPSLLTWLLGHSRVCLASGCLGDRSGHARGLPLSSSSPHAHGSSVPASDRRNASVVARMWHAHHPVSLLLPKPIGYTDCPAHRPVVRPERGQTGLDLRVS
jgi:hypothetical protein